MAASELWTTRDSSGQELGSIFEAKKKLEKISIFGQFWRKFCDFWPTF